MAFERTKSFFGSLANSLYLAIYASVTSLWNKFVNKARSNQNALYKAAQDGDLEKIKQLIQRKDVNPAGENNYALRFNIYNANHSKPNDIRLEIISELLKNAAVQKQLSAQDNYILKIAARKENHELVKKISQLQTVRTSIAKLTTQQFYRWAEGLSTVMQRIISPQQNADFAEESKDNSAEDLQAMESTITPTHRTTIPTLSEELQTLRSLSMKAVSNLFADDIPCTTPGYDAFTSKAERATVHGTARNNKACHRVTIQ